MLEQAQTIKELLHINQVNIKVDRSMKNSLHSSLNTIKLSITHLPNNQVDQLPVMLKLKELQLRIKLTLF